MKRANRMTKKKAIICDLDGTLALLQGRDPFNPDSVADDLLNNPVANILEVYSHQQLFDIQIIFLTGRYEKYRGETEAWLDRHGFANYLLFMRSNADRRKDIFFKKDVYLTHIRAAYDVLFVLEDRDQVVRMWRKDVGLTCLQVEYGDF